MGKSSFIYRGDNPDRQPSHPWMSWHNHTGSFPRFSFCSEPGLSIERYEVALAQEPDAWEGFAITEHAFSIAIPNDEHAWPHMWYDDSAVLDYYIEKGETARRLAAYLEFCDRFCDGKRFFHGIEIESDVNGRTAVPIDMLDRFDVVIASIHQFQGPSEQWAERHFFQLDKVLRIPCDIIGHPVRHLRKFATPGGSLPQEVIDETLNRLEAAGVALEINAHNPQIHDDVLLLRGAFERRLPVVFSLDLHYPEEFGNWRYFEDVVERAGVDYGALNLFKPGARTRVSSNKNCRMGET